MINGSKLDSDVLNFMYANKMPLNNVSDLLNERRLKSIRAHRPVNIGVVVNPNVYTRPVPLGLWEYLRNKTSKSRPATYLMASGNVVSFGQYPQIDSALNGKEAGDAVAQGMELMEDRHPLATLTGDLSGEVMQHILLSRIPGAEPILKSPFGSRAVDAAIGAIEGAGRDVDHPWEGALEGATTSLVGGEAGRRAFSRAARGISRLKDRVPWLNEGLPLRIDEYPKLIAHDRDFGWLVDPDEVGSMVGGQVADEAWRRKKRNDDLRAPPD